MLAPRGRGRLRAREAPPFDTQREGGGGRSGPATSAVTHGVVAAPLEPPPTHAAISCGTPCVTGAGGGGAGATDCTQPVMSCSSPGDRGAEARARPASASGGTPTLRALAGGAGRAGSTAGGRNG
jgi:hypothetical protein